jgi:hypothetical protein
MGEMAVRNMVNGEFQAQDYRRPFIPAMNGAKHDALNVQDRSAQADLELRQQQATLQTVKLRQLPTNQGAIEIQAVALRMAGRTYVEIGDALECGTTLAKTLVEAGSRLLVDEDAVVQLRLHQARLESLLGVWHGLATGQTERPTEQQTTLTGQIVDVPAEGTDRKSATQLTIQLLALQQKLASWADTLPVRGKSKAGEDAFYAEAHAILMAADDSGQWAPEQGLPIPEQFSRKEG